VNFLLTLEPLADEHLLYERYDPDSALFLPTLITASFAAYFGDTDQALNILRTYYDRAENIAWNFIPSEFWRPNYREMRKLDGFKDLLREIGLVDYWQSTKNWGDF